VTWLDRVGSKLPRRLLSPASVVAISLAALGPANALGDEAKGLGLRPEPKVAPAPAPRPAWASPKLWLGFGLVAALGAAAVVVKRKREADLNSAGAYELRVLNSTRLNPRAQLLVASVGDRVMLLGVTEGSVRHLGWLDEGTPVRDLEESAANAIAEETRNLEEQPQSVPPAPAPAARVAEPSLPSDTQNRSFSALLRQSLGTGSPVASTPLPGEARDYRSATEAPASRVRDEGLSAASIAAAETQDYVQPMRRRRPGVPVLTPTPAPTVPQTPAPAATESLEDMVEGQVSGLGRRRRRRT